LKHKGTKTQRKWKKILFLTKLSELPSKCIERVEGRMIIEVKATEKENPIHEVQLLTYLRLTNLRLGLLINFGSKQVKEGIKRVING